MTRLPVCSGAEALAAFERSGWRRDRQRGSHVTLTKAGVPVVLTVPLHGELGELNLQRVRGQGFRIKLWTLKNKDVWQPDPAYSGAPVVVKTEAGEDVVIGVLSTQQRERKRRN